jgi:hypothetical protein
MTNELRFDNELQTAKFHAPKKFGFTGLLRPSQNGSETVPFPGDAIRAPRNRNGNGNDRARDPVGVVHSASSVTCRSEKEMVQSRLGAQASVLPPKKEWNSTTSIRLPGASFM